MAPKICTSTDHAPGETDELGQQQNYPCLEDYSYVEAGLHAG